MNPSEYNKECAKMAEALSEKAEELMEVINDFNMSVMGRGECSREEEDKVGRIAKELIKLAVDWI